MIKLLLLALAALLLIFAPHIATAITAAAGAAAVWAAAQPAVLGGLIGIAARTHITRRLGRY
ncbi:hypothetical protein [Streptomyces sp. DW26H14]|uniref:hypothetical protein n=1 Tax=Streptomyces sp. DW26H14 TaxID=3435395 RepID=UPI00403D656D